MRLVSRRRCPLDSPRDSRPHARPVNILVIAHDRRGHRRQGARTSKARLPGKRRRRRLGQRRLRGNIGHNEQHAAAFLGVRRAPPRAHKCRMRNGRISQMPSVAHLTSRRRNRGALHTNRGRGGACEVWSRRLGNAPRWRGIHGHNRGVACRRHRGRFRRLGSKRARNRRVDRGVGVGQHTRGASPSKESALFWTRIRGGVLPGRWGRKRSGRGTAWRAAIGTRIVRPPSASAGISGMAQRSGGHALRRRLARQPPFASVLSLAHGVRFCFACEPTTRRMQAGSVQRYIIADAASTPERPVQPTDKQRSPATRPLALPPRQIRTRRLPGDEA